MTKEKSEIFLFDDFRVDAATFKLWKGESVVAVEPKAFRVLLFLIHNRGRLIEKDELLDSVWKETSVTENALTREIAKLRRLLGDDPKQSRYIQTVHTRGYRFVANVEVVSNGDDGRDVEPSENGANKSSTPAKTHTPAAAVAANGNGFHVGEATTQAAIVLPDNGALPSVVASETNVTASDATMSDATTATKVKSRRRFSRRALLLAGVIVVAVVAVAAPFAWKFYQESDRPTPPAVLEITPVTTAPGLDLNPSFSPDGSTLAYTSDRNGSLEIYAKPLAPGGREMQLTADGNQNREPAWSPDGSTLAYHSARRGGIWLMPAFGGVPKQLTKFGCSPAWSRDGAWVAFQSESFHDMIQPYASSATLWVVAAAGGEPRQVTRAGQPAGGHLFPTWSPDGRRIAFLNANVNSMQIWSVGVGGDELQQLSPDNSGDKADVVYTPDNESIFFTMGMMLLKLRVSPETGARIGRPAKVADLGSTLFRHPTFSRDGKRLAYSAWTVKSNVWSIALSPQTHETVGSPIALTDELNSRNGITADFSPDGRKIVFTSMRRGSGYQLWLMDADGKGQTQLTTDTQAAYSPSWHALGDKIAFQCIRAGRTTLSTIDVERRTETELIEVGKLEGLRLSPDARQVAFTYAPDKFFNVGVMPVAGGGVEPRQLTFEQTFTGLPSWSPDGRLLAFQSKRGDDMQIMSVPADGSAAPTQLTFDSGDKWPYGWSPDGNKIVYAGARDGIWNVWWLSLADKTTRQLTANTRAGVIIRFPAWSPPGNQIIYEQAELTGNIHVMSLKDN